jgi:hypothetical protein
MECHESFRCVSSIRLRASVVAAESDSVLAREGSEVVSVDEHVAHAASREAARNDLQVGH